MSRIWHHQPHPDNPDRQPLAMPRSVFLARLGFAACALAAGAGALLDTLRSSVPALASAKPALSIGSTMPVVSKIGLFLGNAKALQPNQALAYTDPKSGDPAILIRLANGHLVSYDIVCPHQGCTVPFDPARRLLVCSCHGAQFDPAHEAAPLSGPVSQPLIGLPIRVDAAGNVYALDVRPGTKVNRLHTPPAPSAGDDGGGDDSGSGRHRRPSDGDD